MIKLLDMVLTIMKKKIKVCFFTFIWVSFIAALSPVCVAQVAEKPNVLLILLDDVGYCDINAFAEQLREEPVEKYFYETPRINQIAKEGTMFTQFYACTVCSPTRASLLTGKMNNRMGVWDAYVSKNTHKKAEKPVPEGCHFLDLIYRTPDNRGITYPLAASALHDVKTIPQGLTGYHTAMIGKWHIGSHNTEGFRPSDKGFEEVLAYFDGGGSSYYRPFRASAAATREWDKPGPMLTPQEDYLSDDVAQRVNLFLEEQAGKPSGKPFFLYLAHPAAHGPVQSREDDLAYFTEKAKKPGWIGHKSPEYAGLIKGMDRSVGSIMDKLDELKLADNTAVILISDNGGHPTFTRNTPLRGGKSMLYEGGIRVPMIVRWPGKTEPGTVCDIISDVADIYPTIMEMADVDYNDFKDNETTDGESLVPLFSDLKNREGGYGRKEFYHFYGKLGYGGFHNFATWATLRKGDYKLHYDYQGKVELYNIAADLYEKNNLARQQPERAYEMLVKLTGWLKDNCNPEYLPQPNPNYQSDKSKFGPYVPLEQLKETLLTGKGELPSNPIEMEEAYKQLAERKAAKTKRGKQQQKKK